MAAAFHGSVCIGTKENPVIYGASVSTAADQAQGIFCVSGPRAPDAGQGRQMVLVSSSLSSPLALVVKYYASSDKVIIPRMAPHGTV